jgi:hypothetical protein
MLLFLHENNTTFFRNKIFLHIHRFLIKNFKQDILFKKFRNIIRKFL